jgi:hypothetical protein
MMKRFLLFLVGVASIAAMQAHKPWTTVHWCDSIVEPHWPFAYAKLRNQTLEAKGRTAVNFQNTGHDCTTRGAHSKCHICMDITNTLNGLLANFQYQGVHYPYLPLNVPTISETPWAV